MSTTEEFAAEMPAKRRNAAARMLLMDATEAMHGDGAEAGRPPEQVPAVAAGEVQDDGDIGGASNCFHQSFQQLSQVTSEYSNVRFVRKEFDFMMDCLKMKGRLERTGAQPMNLLIRDYLQLYLKDKIKAAIDPILRQIDAYISNKDWDNVDKAAIDPILRQIDAYISNKDWDNVDKAAIDPILRQIDAYISNKDWDNVDNLERSGGQPMNLLIRDYLQLYLKDKIK
ncbi:hypothetical protein E2562_015353 [Oryza meyeriana var. granulata]|uniref:Uncharacterized protein n=1 Tax=Oryza meyeriana var. granulata TaxID=110450 RepID=A0A6G1EKW5_9ORYZ|nr:hypothetical protein E2562_015353 [Oryza meyeriana var. granulata]